MKTNKKINNDFVRQMCFNYILVSKNEYLTLLSNTDMSICFGLIDCIAHQNSKDYKMYLMAVSNRLYELHRLAYSEDNTITKLSYKEYEKQIFNNNAEDLEEFKDRCRTHKSKRTSFEYDYQTFVLMKKAISKMISNATELIYTSEYAGLIDFIINRDCDLPNPKFGNCMFVTNWKDYNPVDNKITKEFINKYGLY